MAVSQAAWGAVMVAFFHKLTRRFRKWLAHRKEIVS